MANDYLASVCSCFFAYLCTWINSYAWPDHLTVRWNIKISNDLCIVKLSENKIVAIINFIIIIIIIIIIIKVNQI